MQRGFGSDGEHLPAFGQILWLAQPLQGASRLGVRRHPLRSQRQVQPSVAINIVRCHTDVVLFGKAIHDDVLLPGGIFKPNSLRGIDGNDVGLPVAVDVGYRDGITNAEVSIDHLLYQTWNRSLPGRSGSRKPEC